MSLLKVTCEVSQVTINNSEARVGSTGADGSVVVIVAISNGNESNGRNWRHEMKLETRKKRKRKRGG